MKKIKFFAIALATMLTFGLTSCNKDHDEGLDYQTITLKNGDFIEIEGVGTSTDASYPVHFKVVLNEGSLEIENLTSKPVTTEPNYVYQANTSEAVIADMGEKKGLSKIDEYPTSGWASKAAAAAKHGYVVESHGTQLNPEQLQAFPQFKNPDKQYLRFWLKEDKGDGSFEVRYQFPFVPED